MRTQPIFVDICLGENENNFALNQTQCIVGTDFLRECYWSIYKSTPKSGRLVCAGITLGCWSQ